MFIFRITTYIIDILKNTIQYVHLYVHGNETTQQTK